MRQAEQVVVLVASPATIDRDGLHRTNLRLLARALAALEPCPARLPGRRLPSRPAAPEHRAVVGGDQRSACIAAASVIAKTARDRLMAGPVAAAYPGFGFDQHVGYATPEHHAALRAEGLSPLHRRSFQSVAYPPDRRPPDPRPLTAPRSPPGRWTTRALCRDEPHRDEVEAHGPRREVGPRGEVGLGRPRDARPLRRRDGLVERPRGRPAPSPRRSPRRPRARDEVELAARPRHREARTVQPRRVRWRAAAPRRAVPHPSDLPCPDGREATRHRSRRKAAETRAS